MRRAIEAGFDKIRPLFEKGGRLHWAWPAFELQETFFLTPAEPTKRGAHVRDPMDAKRLMILVIYAMIPCILIGMWNTGYQGYLGEGVAEPDFFASVVRGAWHMLPIILVSYAVGGFWELLFAIVRKHEINEGFLVTGMLFPLVLPPTTPLWMVAMGISFGVVIGKEVFGGVGMNILNPALTARAFVFFTYPAVISGAKVWDVTGAWNPLVQSGQPVEGYTGATPLLVVANAERGSSPVQVLNEVGFTWQEMFLGTIPGSIAEVSALGALIGALFLVLVGVGSWRIMAGCVIGLLAITGLFNVLAGPESLPFMALPPHYHLVMGGFAFGAAFMATDPVSASQTNAGRWIYGILIGVLCGLVRVVNPAFPEGMMLAILFMNVFAPLIDYFVVRRTTRRRVARLAAA